MYKQILLYVESKKHKKLVNRTKKEVGTDLENRLVITMVGGWNIGVGH